MKILAIDSSATVASVALCDDERLLSEYTVNNGNTHSETLLPMVETVLRNFGMTPKDVDVFAVSCGPGSFTGVRIGAATVKGLAFSSEKPCVGVSTLHALATNLIGYRGLICPVMNARRSQVYTALFRSDGEQLTRLAPDSAISVSELDTWLEEYGETVRLCGDGYDVATSGITYKNIAPVPERLRHQSAYSVAAVALLEYRKGNFGSDSQLTVTYLRPSQAERELNEKNQKNQNN